MRNPPLIDDEELWTRSAHGDTIRVDAHEVRYLDLSGDGVPDAVEHITRCEFRAHRDDTVDTVEETRRLEYGIGIDGRPAGSTERTQVFTRDRSGRLVPKTPVVAAVA